MWYSLMYKIQKTTTMKLKKPQMLHKAEGNCKVGVHSLCVVQKENISTTRHLIQRINDSFRIEASLFNVKLFQLRNLYTWVYLA